MPTPQPKGSPSPPAGREVEALLAQLRDGAGAREAGQLLSDVLPSLLELCGATSAVVTRPDGDDIVVPAGAGEQGVECVVRRLPGGAGTLTLAVPESRDAALSAAAELGLGLLGATLARLHAEAELRDLAARVDNAQQLAVMGDYDWHIPSDTNRWSDQLYRIYGHEPQSFNASYEKFLSHIHPDDRERITAIHQHAYATGEPYQMIERIVRLDGEVRYLSSNGQVVMDDAGNPVRMRGTCVDITQRVLADDDRARTAARFRSLVESCPDAIVVADGTGEIVQGNGRAAELLGGDPVGRRIDEVLTGQSDDDTVGVAGAGLDGRALRLDVARAPLHEPAGAGEVGADGLVAIFLHDATTRLANEAVAAHLQEAQLRRHQALEINDNVVQGLTTALYALEMGDTSRSVSSLRRTLAAAGRMIDDLVMPLGDEDLAPRDLVRTTASTLEPAKPS
jgi:PAS domain S-box-containing protein